MGAFRTGKSFLLDLFLRHLRYEQKLAEAGEGPPPPTEAPERGGEEEYPLPAWMTDAGTTIEGGVDGAEDRSIASAHSSIGVGRGIGGLHGIGGWLATASVHATAPAEAAEAMALAEGNVACRGLCGGHDR